jgi:hypothetical protein
LVRKSVCLVAYYGGLRTNEVRSIEFGKRFSGGEISFDSDESGYWFCFERSKQRGATETTTICVPRRQSDWVPVVSDSFKSPLDYDPASIIDEYLDLLESDLNLTRDELTGPFFRSTHGVGGLKYVNLPLGVNMLAKVGVEFATQLLLPNSAGFTSHCWRRSCGTNASNAGVNVTTLMGQLGWSNPKTALGYVAKSKIASLTMATFLSNIQRQNKVLDAGGVKSTPKGVQLSKSDNAPRSAKKKLDPVKVSAVGRVDRVPELRLGGSEIGFHLAAAGSLNPECDQVLAEIEADEEIRQAVKNCVPLAEPSSIVVQAQPEMASLSVEVNPQGSVTSVSSSPGTAFSSGSSGSSGSSASFPSVIEFIDPRAAAILQNFQNNGNVQIHFHFNDNK